MAHVSLQKVYSKDKIVDCQLIQLCYVNETIKLNKSTTPYPQIIKPKSHENGKIFHVPMYGYLT